jgi:putative nucleotidyltransferase with HDIG domain
MKGSFEMDIKKEIKEIFGQWLEKINDEKLRESVVSTFENAIKKGGYKSGEELKKIPFSLLTDCKGISFVEHTLAVTYGAFYLAEAQKTYFKPMPYTVNYDRLIAGGLLHDVGKIIEIEPDGKGGFRKSKLGKLLRHPLSGLLVAKEAGVPDEILNIIGCHAKEGEGAPKVIETVLIHQADYATFDPLTMIEKGTLIGVEK